MEFLKILSFSTLAVLVYMNLVFVLALIKRDNSIVDIAWGLGFILVALVGYVANPQEAAQQYLMLTLVLIWGLRLALHIWFRNRGKGEDFRYQQWRREWGTKWVWRSYFQVFILQGALLVVIAQPIILVNSNLSTSLGWLDLIGLMAWLVGFFFESLSDYQLLRFKKNPQNKGRIITSGLWRYSRHPNYFGESVQWFGLALIASTTPYGVFAFISPFLLTFLLLRVSGIPLLERKYADNAEFKEYKARTNAFIPWFSKK